MAYAWLHTTLGLFASASGRLVAGRSEAALVRLSGERITFSPLVSFRWLCIYLQSCEVRGGLSRACPRGRPTDHSSTAFVIDRLLKDIDTELPGCLRDDVPDPVPKRNQVLVEIEATGLKCVLCPLCTARSLSADAAGTMRCKSRASTSRSPRCPLCPGPRCGPRALTLLCLLNSPRTVRRAHRRQLAHPCQLPV
jgi:hypothetical protein